MKFKVLQIVWHPSGPVFSLDFHPQGWLATAGGDIKSWEMTMDGEGQPVVTYLNSFTGNNGAVNCIRFCPTGDVLASGGDRGEMLLWKLAAESQHRGNLGGGSDGDGPMWKACTTLRGHAGDVQDLSWAPDGSCLISGTIERECMLGDVDTRNRQIRLSDHSHFVQGVAWDPCGQWVVSQSADRTCKVYALKPPAAGKKTSRPAEMSQAGLASMLKDIFLHSTLSKRTMEPGAVQAVLEEIPAGGIAAPASVPKLCKHPLFLDESMANFFRRLSWSPDGSFLAIPAGMYKSDPSAAPVNTTYLFARGEWTAPVAHLPAMSKPPLCVRFCPVAFELRPSPSTDAAQEGPIRLPYRLVFAVATADSVYIYDTQSLAPLVLFGGIHVAAITDIAWSPDATFLVMSSNDGYCSAAAFQPGELGTPLAPGIMQAHVEAVMSHAAACRHSQRQVANATAVALKAAAIAATSAAASAAAAAAAEAAQCINPPAAAAATLSTHPGADASASGQVHPASLAPARPSLDLPQAVAGSNQPHQQNQNPQLQRSASLSQPLLAKTSTASSVIDLTRSRSPSCEVGPLPPAKPHTAVTPATIPQTTVRSVPKAPKRITPTGILTPCTSSHPSGLVQDSSTYVSPAISTNPSQHPAAASAGAAAAGKAAAGKAAAGEAAAGAACKPPVLSPPTLAPYASLLSQHGTPTLLPAGCSTATASVQESIVAAAAAALGTAHLPSQQSAQQGPKRITPMAVSSSAPQDPSAAIQDSTALQQAPQKAASRRITPMAVCTNTPQPAAPGSSALPMTTTTMQSAPLVAASDRSSSLPQTTPAAHTLPPDSQQAAATPVTKKRIQPEPTSRSGVTSPAFAAAASASLPRPVFTPAPSAPVPVNMAGTAIAVAVTSAPQPLQQQPDVHGTVMVEVARAVSAVHAPAQLPVARMSIAMRAKQAGIAAAAAALVWRQQQQAAEAAAPEIQGNPAKRPRAD